MHGPVAYTDGACLGNPGPGGWGVRILYANGTVRELGGRAAATTNNRMELQAAIAALQVLHTSPQVAIFTDSRYVIDGLTKWLPAWRRRGWVTVTNTPVKNRDLWMTLESLSHSGVRWQHVYGHRGDPNNERVDTIARACAAGTCPPLFCGQNGAPDDPVIVPAVPPLPPRSVSETPARSHAPARAPGRAYYVSIVHGTVAIDMDWPACAARVRGVSGAQYRKVRTPEELAAFCAAYGVESPQGLTWDSE
jgi:ribonuclease HI